MQEKQTGAFRITKKQVQVLGSMVTIEDQGERRKVKGKRVNQHSLKAFSPTEKAWGEQ